MIGLRRALLALVIVDLLLVTFGLFFVPTTLSQQGPLGWLAAVVIVLVYAWLALYSPMAAGRVDERALRVGLGFGLALGTLFILQLLVPYLTPQTDADSQRSSLISYGVVALLILAAGFAGGWRTRNIRKGIQAAPWCVLVGMLIWYAAEFGFFYLFSNTPTGKAFMDMEMQLDFARSGATDYAAFMMSDLMGAGFFHLLLIGLLIGTALGSLGAFAGKTLSRSRQPA